MIVINFKTYPELTGKKAIENAKICESAAKKTGVEIVIGVQTADIYRVTSQVNIPVFAQHLDPVDPGRNTGLTTALALKSAGASGVFLNHSEQPFTNFLSLEKAVNMAKKNGLETLVFVKDLKIAKKADQLKPDYLALEEPSLVSKTAMIQFPQFVKTIKKFASLVKSFPILGAGIRTKKDVLKSLELGVKGVAFASEFVKTPNPEKLLQDLASCFAK